LVQASLKNVKALCATRYGAFAAIVGEDHHVITWGNTGSLRKLPLLFFLLSLLPSFLFSHSSLSSLSLLSLSLSLSFFFFFFLSFFSFHFVCWDFPFLECGGDSSKVAAELKQVEGICGSQYAFAALKKDGSVTAWGQKGSHKFFVHHKCFVMCCYCFLFVCLFLYFCLFRRFWRGQFQGAESAEGSEGHLQH